ncbi:MAG: ABC transporter permease [Planctomycetes bacterium]|jgi:putative ABC transport system permease protein|nr:ABC transporter permease [Planctomycetota bacterium]
MKGVPIRYSLRNLMRRPMRTVLTLLGLSLLTALIVFLVAFGRSFGRALRVPGDPRVLIALSKRAQTFEFSSIRPSDLDLLENAVVDDLAATERYEPLFSKEIFNYAGVRLAGDAPGVTREGLVHGIRPEMAPALLHGFALETGRLPESGANEALVGRNAASRLRVPEASLAVGAKIGLGDDEEFTVVGVFKAPGTIYENWILADPEDLRQTLRRTDYSFARFKVVDGVDVAVLAKRLSEDERFELSVLPEEVYFADFAEGFANFERFAGLLAVVLAVAGILTGMNTLHNSVVGRTREIGTLRVLGFSKAKVFAAFLVEALLLTGTAGLLGCGIGILTHGLPVRVPVAATFPVVVDGAALATGLVAALLMGFLGLLFPMLRALRMPAPEAVRAA